MQRKPGDCAWLFRHFNPTDPSVFYACLASIQLQRYPAFFWSLIMKRLTAQDFDQELLILFDAYVHRTIDRRGFLEGAQKFAVAGMTAGMLLAALSPNFAQAQQVSPDDKRLKTERVQYRSPAGYGTVQGYLTRPANASGPLPAILVVHENRGLNPHIEDIARRL